MYKFLNPISKEMIYIICFIVVLLVLIAAFILINPNFLFGYFSPGLLGWPGYLPWSSNGYGGLYGAFGYGGGYPYLSYPYFWGNSFLYNPAFLGSIFPWWNIYGTLVISYP